MNVSRHISFLLAFLLLSATVNAVQIRRQPGHRLPERYYRTDLDDPALWTDNTDTYYKRSAAPGAYALSDIPRTGVIEYPVILVDFSDLKFTIQDDDSLRKRYDQIFNEHGYTDTATYHHKGHTIYGATGSVSDYFRDQSYGKYIPKFKIIGPVHLSKSYAYYGQGEYDASAHIQELVREACNLVITNKMANLSGYAPEGRIYQLSIIYAGKGENYVGSDPNTIWPQASEIWFNSKSDIQIVNSGIQSARFTCVCELFMDSDSILDGIGTFCHEFSHTLGLPDFYNTENSEQAATDDEDNAAMGFWSIMDYGNYENEGFSPVGYTAFEKYSLGWLDLEEITYSGLHTLNEISQEPDPGSDKHGAYRLSTGDDDQFIILENHVKTGWYKYHKSEGLMVTAVDYYKSGWQSNTLNRYNPKHYRILPADNEYKRTGNAGDLFPYTYTDSKGTHVVDSITTRGNPELKAGTSYPLFSIYNITRSGNQVTFRAGYDLPSGIESPRSDEVSIQVSDGGLSVIAPTGSNVTIYDISGKPVFQTTTVQTVQQVDLPGRGIWIVKCGNITRKVRL